MRILVTGASGHLGYHIVKRLVLQGYKVKALIRPTSFRQHLDKLAVEICLGDVLERDSVLRACRGVDTVFHTACIYDLSSNCDSKMIRATAVDGTRNLLDCCAHEKPKRIIYTSSVETIGASSDKSVSLTEEDSFIDMPYAYSRAKVEAENLCLELSKKYGLSTVICNPATIIGQDDYKLTPSNAMLLTYARLPLFYVDSGQSIVDVQDVAEGHILACKNGRELERYILGGDNIEIKDLLDIIKRALGKNMPSMKLGRSLFYAAAFMSEKLSVLTGKGETLLTIPKAKKMYQKYNYYNSQKAMRELGYVHRSITDTLPATLSWLLNRYGKKGNR